MNVYVVDVPVPGMLGDVPFDGGPCRYSCCWWTKGLGPAPPELGIPIVGGELIAYPILIFDEDGGKLFETGNIIFPYELFDDPTC